MIEGKKNNIEFFMAKTSAVGDAAVCLGFDADVNGCCLNKLKGACSCNCYPSASEEACVCFALYLTVQNKLCGTPQATTKSKVGSVECGTNNGQFFMCWNVKNNASAVRKSLGLALSCLSPGKQYSTYVQCVRAVSPDPKKYKPVREEFNYVADQIARSIKKQVVCGAVGNLSVNKITSEKLDELVAVLANKFACADVDGTKKKPTDHLECDHKEFTELKVKSWQQFAVHQFLNDKLKGTAISPGSSLMVSMHKDQFETKAKKLKSSVKDFSAKYNNAAEVFVYGAFSNAGVSARDVKSLVKSGLSAADVEKAIGSAL